MLVLTEIIDHGVADNYWEGKLFDSTYPRMAIHDIETGKHITTRDLDYYYDKNVCGILYDKESEYLYLCPVWVESLFLLDCIKDVKITKSISRDRMIIRANCQPINSFYAREGKLHTWNSNSHLVYITDLVLSLFIEISQSNYPAELYEDMKKRKYFLIDCANCGNKYKVEIEDKFLTQITKFVMFYGNNPKFKEKVWWR